MRRRPRCPDCGVPLPDASGRCPTCGHETDGGVVVAVGEIGAAPGQGPASAAPPPPNRTVPRGRRTALAILAVAALAIGLLVVVDRRSNDAAEGEPTSAGAPSTTARERRRRPVPPTTAAATTATLPDGPTGLRLVSSDTGDLVVHDFDTGAKVIIELPAPAADGDEFMREGMTVGRGGGVVTTNGERAFYVAPLASDATMVDLGPALQVLASDRSDRVWLVDGYRYRAGEIGVREVDLAGRVTVETVTLPTDVYPVGAVADGLVLGSSDGVFQLRRDGSFRRVARGTVAGLAGSEVLHRACNDRLECGLFFTSIRTGDERRVPGSDELLEPGYGGGHLSPDGSFLISVSYQFDESEFAVFDVDRGRIAYGPEPLGTHGIFGQTWSPDGEWLFFSTETEMHAYRTSDWQAVELAVGERYSFVVVGSEA